MKHVVAGATVAEILSHSARRDWKRFFKIASFGGLPMVLAGLLTTNVVGWLTLWFFILWPVFGAVVMRRGQGVLAMKVQERLRPGSTDLAYYTPVPKVDRSTAVGEYKWIQWMIGESDTVALLREATGTLYAAIGNPAMRPYIPMLCDMYVEQAANAGVGHDMWHAEIEALVSRVTVRRREVGL